MKLSSSFFSPRSFRCRSSLCGCVNLCDFDSGVWDFSSLASSSFFDFLEVHRGLQKSVRHIRNVVEITNVLCILVDFPAVGTECPLSRQKLYMLHYDVREWSAASPDVGGAIIYGSKQCLGVCQEPYIQTTFIS